MYLFIYSFAIRHKHKHYNLQAIEMKVESSIDINNVHGRHRKDFALISQTYYRLSSSAFKQRPLHEEECPMRYFSVLDLNDSY